MLLLSGFFPTSSVYQAVFFSLREERSLLNGGKLGP